MHTVEMYTQDTQVWLPMALAILLSLRTEHSSLSGKCFNGLLLSVRYCARSGAQTHNWDMVPAVEVLEVLAISFHLLLNTNLIILWLMNK